MKIAVIGAGISGLAAGRELANAGHYVVVFEENTNYGGRLATYNAGKNNEQLLDFGAPFLQVTTNEFQNFVDELKKKNLVDKWEGNFSESDANGNIHSQKIEAAKYVAPKGMHSIARYLGRTLDVRVNEKVGGITNIGENRIKKRAWMLNFPSAATENFDAVIIAGSARQAYAVLNMTTDETEILTLIREIDEVEYTSQFSFLAGYGDAEMPEWNALQCKDDIIDSIINESTKRESNTEHCLVVHTTNDFAKKYIDEDRNTVSELILARLSDIVGGWAGLPEWQHIHFWRYAEAKNPLPYDFMELNSDENLLALTGGYFNDSNMESAYLSGLKLGRYWVEKFS